LGAQLDCQWLFKEVLPRAHRRHPQFHPRNSESGCQWRLPAAPPEHRPGSLGSRPEFQVAIAGDYPRRGLGGGQLICPQPEAAHSTQPTNTPNAAERSGLGGPTGVQPAGYTQCASEKSGLRCNTNAAPTARILSTIINTGVGPLLVLRPAGQARQ
jgi:hypothetical protein